MTIVGGLEKIIGKEMTGKLKNNWAYKFCADAIAMNVFSLAYAINEKLIMGMSWGDTGKARLAAAVGNTITATPYRIYRDWTMKKLKVKETSHWLKKYLADVLIFVTGQTPLYFLYLLPTGANFEDMLKGATTLTLIAPLAGRPQGATYDYVRDQFGLKSAYAKDSDTSSTPQTPSTTDVSNIT